MPAPTAVDDGIRRLPARLTAERTPQRTGRKDRIR